MPVRIGTRPSPLAIVQAEEAIAYLKSMGISGEFEIVPIESEGDIDKVTSLALLEGGDFFTGAIEEALLDGKVDIAVHSAKDLEDDQPHGLVVAAMTPSVSPHEALVSRKGGTIDSLGAGCVVGTSSKKRRDNLLSYRPDLKCADIRGNIGERIALVDNGTYDAIIVAHAALIRLGLEHRMSQILPPDIFRPHPLQGRLAIQLRRSDQRVSLLAPGKEVFAEATRK